eukprot:jgi/Botrbrau1/19270/Bobra.0073s0019.1
MTFRGAYSGFQRGLVLRLDLHDRQHRYFASLCARHLASLVFIRSPIVSAANGSSVQSCTSSWRFTRKQQEQKESMHPHASLNRLTLSPHASSLDRGGRRCLVRWVAGCLVCCVPGDCVARFSVAPCVVTDSCVQVSGVAGIVTCYWSASAISVCKQAVLPTSEDATFACRLSHLLMMPAMYLDNTG